MIKIDGLDTIEALSLKKELDANEIVYNDLERDRNDDDPDRYHEFLSTAAIVIAGTNLALQVIKIWLKKRAKKKTSASEKITIELPDGVVITIEKGSTESGSDPEKQIDSVVSVIKALGGLFKSME